MMQFEVCANSFNSAQNAEKAGAQRVELCAELGVGGLTPSFGLIEKVSDELNIKVNLLVRPRSGNFVYTEEEFDVMLRDIRKSVDLGVNAIVSGVLHHDNSRAFDLVNDPHATLEQLASIGVTRILSSGQKPTALEGIELLAALKDQTAVQIMPGSGINAQNIQTFISRGFKEVHFSGTLMGPLSQDAPKIPFITPSLISETAHATSDLDKLKKIIAAATSKG
jgi:copper homeostasis protein